MPFDLHLPDGSGYRTFFFIYFLAICPSERFVHSLVGRFVLVLVFDILSSLWILDRKSLQDQYSEVCGSLGVS